MKIRIYNSLTNQVEDFVPIKEGEVSMYVCGPTVYNYPHIGNMRPVVTFDTVRRFFEYIGYKVTYVSNFTDVDDKIIAKAKEEHKSEKELTDYFIEEFKKTIHSLGSKDPNITPRVTEYMSEIIRYIDNLVKVGAAYNVNGNVYFRVSQDEDYGCLSGITPEQLLVGARIEANSEKESPLDFVLWKKTDEGIKWNSPWGEGRPGWHTECCVMIDSIFHGMIDIHGGGYDLKFPHHENEIAQCNATHHHHIAKYWMHNAFINVNNEKMSKSLGNVILAKDLIDQVGGNVVRMDILSTHYRLPVNFTDETINAARQSINRLESCMKQLTLKLQLESDNIDVGKPTYIDNFLNCLADDFNTSNALTEVFNVVKEVNIALRSREVDLEKLQNLYITLRDMLSILGLDIPFVRLSEDDKSLYREYLNAKSEKDFAKSDELREILMKRGIL